VANPKKSVMYNLEIDREKSRRLILWLLRTLILQQSKVRD